MKILNLNNGKTMPALGFGTWQLTGGKGEEAVKQALAVGYRLIDTARIYGNEQEVGQAIAASGIDRADIFLTTKIWTSDLGYDNTKVAFDESLERLGLEYVDLCLIHWPGQDANLREQSWRALMEINGLGTAKSIGLSNFDPEQIEELIKVHNQLPAVNQIEFHPFIYEKQKPTLDYCAKNNILVEAYSPLAQAIDLKNPVITSVAEAHSKTPAQVLLRWAITHGTVPIPRSSNPERMAQNIDVFDFELSKAEMDKLNSLSVGRSVL